MQTLFKQILKQSNKIVRILTKLSEEYPKMSETIDLALYASVKIQKLVNKHLGQTQTQKKISYNEGEYSKYDKVNCNDDYFSAALQNIENFKKSTFKLQRKINVFINQQDTHKGRKITIPQISQEPIQKRQKAFRKKANSKRQSQRQSNQDQSKNLSEMDASIANLIEKIMELNEPKNEEQKHSNR